MKEAHRSLHRFAVSPSAVAAGQVWFSSVAARQMRRVLRLQPGDRVSAFDGRGREYVVSLVSLRDADALGIIESTDEPAVEPSLSLTLFQALLPREKFEVVLQKGTEVGVRRFVPVVTERSLVRTEVIEPRRQERWHRILLEAAEQSGRTVIPDLVEPLAYSAALQEAATTPSLLAWERETSLSVRQALSQLEPRLRGGQLGLFIGPEGGFSTDEALAARAAGAVTISLGPRVLRTETAGPVLAALALYQAGDLEPIR